MFAPIVPALHTGGGRLRMDDSVWKPHTTVAAMCEHEGKFLLVREMIKDKEVINQPAGHLNPGESLLDAVIRETLEETQYEFHPTGLVGIYRFVSEQAPEWTYIRFLFCGNVGGRLNGPLDEGILSAEWMNFDQIKSSRAQHRSPLVLQSIEDYLGHSPYPLDVISKIFP